MKTLIVACILASLQASAIGVYSIMPFKPVQSELSRAGDLGTLTDLKVDLAVVQSWFDNDELDFQDAAEFCEDLTETEPTHVQDACANMIHFADNKL